MKVLLRRAPLALALLAAVAAVTIGQSEGKDTLEAWQLTARYTARAGFPFLLIAFAASSLARLWPNALTGLVLSQRRWWGLGFATTHTVHLYAFLKYYELLGHSVSKVTALVGGGAYVAMFVMAVTSFDAAQRELGKIWKQIHKVGIYWLWAIFTISYGSRAVTGKEPMISITFTVLLIAALGLRGLAWRHQREAEYERLRRRTSRRKRRTADAKASTQL